MFKNIAWVLLVLGNVTLGQQFQSLDDSTKLNDSVYTLVYTSSDYLQQNDPLNSLKTAIKALQLAEISEDEAARAFSLNSLGNVYNRLQEKEKAEVFFNDALKICEDLQNLDIQITALNGLSEVYAKLHGDPDKAIAYLEKSLSYGFELNQPVAILVSLINLTDLLVEQNRTVEAKQQLDKLLIIYNFYTDSIPEFGPYQPYYELYSEYLRGVYAMQQESYENTSVFLNKARAVGEEHQLLENLIDIHYKLYEIDEILGRTDRSKTQLYKIVSYQNQLFDTEKNNHLEIIKTRFEVDQYRKQLDYSNKEKEVLTQVSLSKSKTIFAAVFGMILLILVMALMYYIYRRRKANDQLIMANKALEQEKRNALHLSELKSKFISRASHEIRTPLYGIIGITSMLREDDHIKEHHEDLINALKFSGDHLIKLVDTLINLKQIEEKTIQLHLTDTNLHATIENIINSFKYLAKENSNTIDLTIDPSITTTYQVDEVRFSEVLINLIENALKFTIKGSISIAVAIKKGKENKDLLYFEVTDTGEGISNEQQSRVFEKFNKGKEEENIYEGAGLGLSTVKYLLELMDSKVHLKSKIGSGSTFSFSLWLEKGGKLGTCTNKTFKRPFILKKILIVEDNKISQLITRKLIHLMGHECVIADNGLEALELIKNEDVDLILMDLNMPIMNGFDAAKAIKAHLSNVKIIALTATDVSKVRDKCFASGMEDVINKPIDKHDLDITIRRYAG